MLDDLALVVDAVDVDAGHVPRLEVHVHGDEIAFRDHAVHITSTGPTGAKTSLTAWSPLPACGLCCTQSSTISSSKASTSPARKASKRRATACLFRSVFAIA